MSQETLALTARRSFELNNSHNSTSNTVLPLHAASSLKRRASPAFEYPDETSRKRMREELADNERETLPEAGAAESSGSKVVDELNQELQCGCCAELVYRPVLVIPCQHFFCGSCCVLWVRNGGTNCPACRSVSTVAMPFRALQPLIDTLLKHHPEKARTEREREQADEIYKSGQNIRIPPPREPSPPPDVNRSTEYYHPCPHCLPNNPYDWRCPQPVADPGSDIDNAWHLDDGPPPGHSECRNCENLLAIRAPTTTKCDLCFALYCGIGVQDRCVALPFAIQHPHGFSSHLDMIQSADVYGCFNGNTVEVEIMLEYIEAQEMSPRHIYRDASLIFVLLLLIVQHIQKQPRGFDPLIDDEVFGEYQPLTPEESGNVPGERTKACRSCAQSLLIWGLKDWWVRERAKGHLEPALLNRKDCPNGANCLRARQDNDHAKEFNHVFASTPSEIPADAPAILAPVPPPNAQVDPPLIVNAPIADALPALPPSPSGGSLSFLLNPDEEPNPPERRHVLGIEYHDLLNLNAPEQNSMTQPSQTPHAT